MRSSNAVRSRAVLVVIVVLVIGAIAAAAVLSAVRTAPEFDPATPEGVAQSYFEALLDDNEEDALALMTTQLRERCGDRSLRTYFLADSVRVVLESADIGVERAVVEVEIDQISDPSPFDVDGYSMKQRIVMTAVDGGWEISEVPWPFFCPEGS
jgi:hypothetical protein